MKITMLPALDADTEFARVAHHRAYRDVVMRQYGTWDEKAQDRFFMDSWAPGMFEIILCDGVPCGYICVEDRGTDLYVRELIILPEFQGKGIGSQIMRGVFGRASIRQVPVRLETQRNNRAAELYRRLGFREYGQAESHFLMEWNHDAI
jgi:ribosomal protein S18 acetylase RimI-like enzyme